MVSIKEISKISGYSKTTVSKALNNYPDVSRETKEKILKICNLVCNLHFMSIYIVCAMLTKHYILC